MQSHHHFGDLRVVDHVSNPVAADRNVTLGSAMLSPASISLSMPFATVILGTSRASAISARVRPGFFRRWPMRDACIMFARVSMGSST